LNFKDGELHGISKEYYENEKLKEEQNLENSKRNGTWRLFYESGNLNIEGNFKDDKRYGIFKEYYENGKLKRWESYKNGKKQFGTIGILEWLFIELAFAFVLWQNVKRR
jgi:antitoxin component YwqK of YwqJK toxin-antitoxin module